MAALGNTNFYLCKSSDLGCYGAASVKATPLKAIVFLGRGRKSEIYSGSSFVPPIKAMEASETTTHRGKQSVRNSHKCSDDSGESILKTSTVGNSSNILWHKCSVEKGDRQALLNQKGCVIWITGLSGSGKSTVACALSRALHARGKLTYILDGDNCRHGLNCDLSFKSEDRAENIRRIGEVAKLFADAGVICIASLISPFRKERDACRNLLPEGDFIEVYMDVPLEVCETRDPKGLYKLARAGKIKGFTGVDDPYEPPLNSEIVLQQREESCDSPTVQAEKVVSYLETKGWNPCSRDKETENELECHLKTNAPNVKNEPPSPAPIYRHPRPHREPERLIEWPISPSPHLQRQPNVPRVPQVCRIPPVCHENKRAGQPVQLHHMRTLREERDPPENPAPTHARVPHLLPRAHNRPGRVHERLVRCPSSAPGCDHVVHATVLEQRRGLPVLPQKDPAAAVCHVEVVLAQQARVELAVVLRRVDEVGSPIVILEDGHVPALAPVGPHAAEVHKRACGLVGNSNTRGGPCVVAIVHVHPHHVLACPVVVDDLGPLEDVRWVEVVGLVAGLGSQYDALVLPCP
ncbi:adenylyl-sulfate kinase [Striga asiatica]|uniref:adenylyl-sulfate kinase n=1 Tax=Striga asiatica TaxID=4170 RepID=A0A5A7RHJ5_STRAF|nr:adenylyl-sulfate kinase [Striga asiatica]